MPIGRKAVVTLAIGRTHVTAARFAGGLRRLRCVAIRTVSAEEDRCADALRALAETGILRRAGVRVVVPRHAVTTRVVTLPSTDAPEIGRMVQLGAPSYVPYPVEELVIDHAVLGTTSDGYSTVLVVLVRREEISRILTPLREARIRPDSVTVSSLALYNAYAAGGPRSEDGPVAIVHVAASGLDVVVVDDGQLSFMRGVSWSGEWKTDGPVAEAAAGTVVHEARASIESSQREAPGRAPVTKMYLSGESAYLDGLRRRFETELDVHVELLDPPARGCPIPAAVLAGAALSSRAVRQIVSVDLRPPDYLAARAQVAHRRRLVACGGLLLAAILLAGQLSRERARSKLAYLSYLEERIAAIEPTARLVREKRSRVAAVRAQLDREFSVLDFMAKIHALAPKDMVLLRVEFNHEENGAIIQARARDRDIAFDYVDRLRKSEAAYLDRVELGTLGVSQERGTAVINFEVIVPFAAPEQEIESETEQFFEDEQT